MNYKADEKAKKLVDTLMGFVERASEKGATPEEVKALPEVAKVLREIIWPL